MALKDKIGRLLKRKEKDEKGGGGSSVSDAFGCVDDDTNDVDPSIKHGSKSKYGSSVRKKDKSMHGGSAPPPAPPPAPRPTTNAKKDQSVYAVATTPETPTRTACSKSGRTKKKRKPISAVHRRLISEGVPIISENLFKFNDEQLGIMEEYCMKRNTLRLGDLIESGKKNKYTIHGILGEGEFAVVLLAEINDSMQFYAYKSDRRKHETKMRFKNEVAVLEAAKTKKLEHLPTIFEAGKCGLRSFIAMTHLGVNFVTIREQAIHRRGNFHAKSITLLALGSLTAIAELHSIGFIHRDINPTNLVIGPTQEAYTTVYLVDFGSAAKIDDKQDANIKHDASFTLRGPSLIFAALEAHKGEPHTRKSDLFSWLLTLIDLVDKDALPWKKWEDCDKVYSSKKAYFKADRETTMMPMPKMIVELAGAIDECPKDPGEDYYDKLRAIVTKAKRVADETFPNVDLEWSTTDFKVKVANV